jgi:hypothetical protein
VRFRGALAWFAGSWVLAVVRPASALDGQVSATTAAQLYSVSSPFGGPEIVRRRYTQTLGLELGEMQGESKAVELSFRSRLRLDADFGQSRAERDPDALDRFVPGLAAAPLDLMYAYLEGDRIQGRPVGFRVGRQYVADALGYWSFDGLLVRVGPRRVLELEAYGGFEQRAVLPALSLSRFTPDGVYRGSRERLEADVWPSYLEERKAAPAFGFSATTQPIPELEVRLGYRRVTERDTVYLASVPNAAGRFDVYRGSRVSSERVGGGIALRPFETVAATSKAVFDVYTSRLVNLGANLEYELSSRSSLGLDFERARPVYDGDSIFNAFALGTTSTLLLEARHQLSTRTTLESAVGARSFGVAEDHATEFWPNGAVSRAEDTPAVEADGVLEANARHDWSAGSVLVVSEAELGASGHRVGADLTLNQFLAGGTYDVLAILSLWDWEDRLEPERGATSLGYVLGGALHPSRASRLGVEWEHDMNRLVGQRFRVLATLELAVPL